MIKILHLYHDLMNLYGDRANAEVLTLALRARGLASIIEKKSVGDDIDIGAYDFLYIGSGTERSVHACLRDIVQYKDTLVERIENGMNILATGNAHEIFGYAIIDADAKRHDALGVLDFETVQGSARVTGDCVGATDFLQDQLIGFINRASIGQTGTTHRPFAYALGPGANDASKTEGIRYKNLLGTYMTGPILVRNPPLLRYFTDKLTEGREAEAVIRFGSNDIDEGESDTYGHSFFTFQEDAYQKALKELLARIEK
ncbi:MAG: glutamine amidotransferase [Oscillospiraceae bacterium]|nr:glutamine amidotransferase [Oscillospiraceae bacterium]